jgi:hypothetical protein
MPFLNENSQPIVMRIPPNMSELDTGADLTATISKVNEIINSVNEERNQKRLQGVAF